VPAKTSADDSNEAVVAAWRAESARLVGALTRMTRDLGLAEDLAQDALVAALEQWPTTGVPENPVWRQDTTKAAEPRAKLSRRGLRWALEGIVCQHLTVARIAEGLGVAWNTANDAVLAEGKRVLINDPARFEGVTTIGVDEHVWRHTRRGDKYVTVIIDLTPIRNKTGRLSRAPLNFGGGPRDRQAATTLSS